MAVSLQASTGVVIPHGRKASRNTAALLLSGAAHLAVLVVIVRYGFLAQPAEIDKDAPPIVVEPARLTPPDRPKVPPPPSHPTLAVRDPAPSPYVPPVVFDAVPVDVPPTTNAGPLEVPTAPVSPAVEPPAPPAPPVAPPRPSVIASPTWLRQPSLAQTASAYPARAAEAGLGGKATLNCVVLASGAVDDCQVSTETPRGEGFGSAAQKLSRFFVLKPRTEDGKMVEGARVSIPLTFTPPGE